MRGAGLLVGGIRVVGALAGTVLDRHLKPVLDQAFDHLRHQRHTALTRRNFLGY